MDKSMIWPLHHRCTTLDNRPGFFCKAPQKQLLIGRAVGQSERLQSCIPKLTVMVSFNRACWEGYAERALTIDIRARSVLSMTMMMASVLL